ncbi:SulP family inorganic anion transporter [Lysobacter yananisis]|uniref:SulP family inorganic anion transporter n=1 Tax=Lysobacter yananisis TaxID=1003114 RepID=A0ABY9PFM8_9GAMM|nr:SulP family inorganic anion transporter [Lysobacter yananisis]WMT05870.1 SulP family inorganic anion transporter [Lysobacter yananisis]
MNAACVKNYFAQGLFGRDLLGSVVVFLVALPLCMGIAIASDMPPAAGLITGIVGGVVVGAIAGSPLQVSGPAAGLAVLVFELVREHGASALGPVILLAGAIQLLAGLCRAGVWFRMTSPAVVAGMLSGIGILIVASQLHVLIDAVPKARGLENFAAFPAALGAALSGSGDANATALLVGIATIAILLLWDTLRPARLRFLPGALLAVVALTALSQLLALDVKRVQMPSNLLAAISLPNADSLSRLAEPAMLAAAFTFALIASAETLLSAAAVDRMHDGPRTGYDRELGAQGVGNLICGALGALPMTGVIVRSATNVQAGSATRMATIFHGLLILLFAALLPWLVRMTPVACLAGILVYIGAKMINLRQARSFAAFGKGWALIYFATVAAIVATDLLVGVLIGFALSLLRLALQASRLQVRLVHDADGRASLRLEGSATFLKVPAMARALERVPPNTRVRLDHDRLHHLDQACLELLRDWGRNASARGCELAVDWQELQRRVEGAPARG